MSRWRVRPERFFFCRAIIWGIHWWSLLNQRSPNEAATILSPADRRSMYGACMVRIIGSFNTSNRTSDKIPTNPPNRFVPLARSVCIPSIANEHYEPEEWAMKIIWIFHIRFLNRTPEILHQAVWRTWLFIAYSDQKGLYYQFSLPHLNIFSLKCWENVLFELRVSNCRIIIVSRPMRDGLPA